jgi:uroporphyrinogen-III synthase
MPVIEKQSHKKLLGKITLKTGEGITGWVAAHKKTVILSKNAYRDERFKFFKELPEDLYEAFLSVPIVDKEGVVGVINFQNKKPYNFNTEQIHTVEAIVKIIASAFENVALERKVVHLETKLEERKIIEKAKGILMKQKNISEKDAYDLLQSEAMKKRKSMKDIADAVINVIDTSLYPQSISIFSYGDTIEQLAAARAKSTPQLTDPFAVNGFIHSSAKTVE